jgi:repressor LexA
MGKKQMSRRQQDVYDFIKEYHADNGISPSIGDIADGLGLGNTPVNTYVDTMKRRGFVKSLPGIPRSLTVVAQEQVAAPVVQEAPVPVEA